MLGRARPKKPARADATPHAKSGITVDPPLLYRRSCGSVGACPRRVCAAREGRRYAQPENAGVAESKERARRDRHASRIPDAWAGAVCAAAGNGRADEQKKIRNEPLLQFRFNKPGGSGIQPKRCRMQRIRFSLKKRSARGGLDVLTRRPRSPPGRGVRHGRSGR